MHQVKSEKARLIHQPLSSKTATFFVNNWLVDKRGGYQVDFGKKPWSIKIVVRELSPIWWLKCIFFNVAKHLFSHPMCKSNHYLVCLWCGFTCDVATSYPWEGRRCDGSSISCEGSSKNVDFKIIVIHIFMLLLFLKKTQRQF